MIVMKQEKKFERRRLHKVERKNAHGRTVPVSKKKRLFGTMDSSSFLPSRPGPRETTPRRPLTKAARRDVRRRLALAAEMKVFSVSIDGVVWTLFHPEMRAHKPSSPDDPAGGAAQGSSASTISPNCK